MPIVPRNPEVVKNLLESPLFLRLASWEVSKLIEQFGDDVFNVLLENPQRFRAKAPLHRSKRQYVIDRAKAVLAVWVDYVFLTRHGVSPFAAARTVEALGEGCRHRLETDPYGMLSVDGVDFPDADALALSVGTKRDDSRRLLYGADWVLSRIGQQGHTCMPRSDLVALLARELGVNAEQVKDKVRKKLSSRRWVARDIGTTTFIAGRDSARKEEACARYIARMLDREVRKIAPGSLPAKLNDKQRQAVMLGLNQPLSIITGGPGTGKTTVLEALLKRLEQAGGGRTVLAAPTGKAAQRMRESTGQKALTLHSLLEYHPDWGFRRHEKRPLAVDTLIVDETSMVDTAMLHALLKALPETARLILVGDHDQVPSIQSGSVLRDMIESECIPATKLTEVYRQAENSEILSAAHAIKVRQKPVLTTHGHDFIWYPERGDAAIARRIKDIIENEIQQHHGIPLSSVQVLTPQKNTAAGVEQLNRLLQPILNPNVLKRDIPCVQRKGEKYRPGERVMVTRNNRDMGLSNGEIGHILSLNKQMRQVEIDFGDRTLTLPFDALNQMTLAYATTIHKAQGSEYDAVIIPVSGRHARMLSPKLLYTAATRGKKLLIMVGEEQALERGLQNSHQEVRHTLLKDYLQEYCPVLEAGYEKRSTPGPSPDSGLQIEATF